MASVKKPSGVAIARSGNRYTITWKQGEKYPFGQNIKYRTKTGGRWSKWTEDIIGQNVVSKVLTLTATTIQGIEFQVRGQTGVYKKMAFGKTKKDVLVSLVWSGWASATWTAKKADVPTLTYANTGNNSGTFTWSVASSATDNVALVRVEAQTCMVRSTAAPSEAQWGSLITKGASGSQAITEDTEQISAGNFIRWYRVRAVGPGGTTAWRTASHAYGLPTPSVIKSASGTRIGSITRLTVTWNDAYNALRPIDKLILQYVIGVPTDTSLTPPSSGWADALEVAPNGRDNMVVCNVEDTIDTDEVMWVRVKSNHDGYESFSNLATAQRAKLATPTLNAVPNTQTGSVSITITEETSCSAARTVIFYRAANNPSNDRIVAILSRGTTTTTLNIPDIIGASTTCFGAYAFVGANTGLIVTKKLMSSDIVLDSDIGAVAPRVIIASEGPETGSVRIGWEWTWTAATQAELSWSDSEYAWESTNSPSTYVVEDWMAESWIIAGLALGKRWYFRVRLLQKDDDNDVTGPWSATAYYDLTSTPDRPALTLSKSVVNRGESVTARWAFSSPDGTRQAYAEICRVTYNSQGAAVYGAVLAHVSAGQSVEIRQNWVTGTTYYMAVRTTSTSGIQSPWSEPVSLYAAEPVNIAITQSNLRMYYTPYNRTYEWYVDPETGVGQWMLTSQSSSGEVYAELTSENIGVYFDGNEVITSETATTRTTIMYSVNNNPVLMAMPLTVTITGAGATGTIILSVVRAEDYHIDRPDGNDYDGFAGETVATKTQFGEAQMTIAVDELVGGLDDGAGYNLIATVIDGYGQSASITVLFRAAWLHKAGLPSVQIAADKYQRIMQITPVAPSNYATGDVCDIYRLTIDKPELIYRGAEFGTTYVDPYPGFGEFCGHRLVTRTANGDYVTASELGWYDAGQDDGDIIVDDNLVIDVDGDQIELPYNLSISNTWKKDFKRTSYLGGSVQGDWNPAVTRDMNAGTVIVKGDDLDRQISMRNLAGYAGIAHVRTPDGSSFAADIQINESQNYDTAEVSYSLTIQAIDPETPEGMTLEEWNAAHPVGS